MKSKNKLPAALLSNGQEPKQYQVNVSLSGGHSVSIQTTDRDIAQAEFNKVKAAGIYGGRWVEHVELQEQPRD